MRRAVLRRLASLGLISLAAPLAAPFPVLASPSSPAGTPVGSVTGSVYGPSTLPPTPTSVPSLSLSVPSGTLPLGTPESVTVTISGIPTGTTDQVTLQTPSSAGLSVFNASGQYCLSGSGSYGSQIWGSCAGVSVSSATSTLTFLVEALTPGSYPVTVSDSFGASSTTTLTFGSTWATGTGSTLPSAATFSFDTASIQVSGLTFGEPIQLVVPSALGGYLYSPQQVPPSSSSSSIWTIGNVPNGTATVTFNVIPYFSASYLQSQHGTIPYWVYNGQNQLLAQGSFTLPQLTSTPSLSVSTSTPVPDVPFTVTASGITPTGYPLYLAEGGQTNPYFLNGSTSSATASLSLVPGTSAISLTLEDGLTGQLIGSPLTLTPSASVEKSVYFQVLSPTTSLPTGTSTVAVGQPFGLQGTVQQGGTTPLPNAVVNIALGGAVPVVQTNHGWAAQSLSSGNYPLLPDAGTGNSTPLQADSAGNLPLTSSFVAVTPGSLGLAASDPATGTTLSVNGLSAASAALPSKVLFASLGNPQIGQYQTVTATVYSGSSLAPQGTLVEVVSSDPNPDLLMVPNGTTLSDIGGQSVTHDVYSSPSLVNAVGSPLFYSGYQVLVVPTGPNGQITFGWDPQSSGPITLAAYTANPQDLLNPSLSAPSLSPGPIGGTGTPVSGSGGGGGSFIPGPGVSTATGASATIGPRGGTISTSNGSVQITIPPGAFNIPIPVSITQISATSSQAVPVPTGPENAASSEWQIHDGGVILQKPAALTFQYNPSVLGNLPSGRVAVFYYNTAQGRWNYVFGTADAQNHTITVETRHFSTWVVMVNIAQLSDVPAHFWAASDINTLVGAGAISGFPNGTFQPDAPVSRAQFVKILALALGIGGQKGGTPFADVPPSAWFAPYVKSAYKAGLVQGIGGGQFGPNTDIVRQAVAVILMRQAFGITPTYSQPPYFADWNRIAPWAQSAVVTDYEDGIFKGVTANRFGPTQNLTRAQAAVAIVRLLRFESGKIG